MIRRAPGILLAVLMLLGLEACGQMGPLYLPEDAAAEADSEEERDDERDE